MPASASCQRRRLGLGRLRSARARGPSTSPGGEFKFRSTRIMMPCTGSGHWQGMARQGRLSRGACAPEARHDPRLNPGARVSASSLRPFTRRRSTMRRFCLAQAQWMDCRTPGILGWLKRKKWAADGTLDDAKVSSLCWPGGPCGFVRGLCTVSRLGGGPDPESDSETRRPGHRRVEPTGTAPGPPGPWGIGARAGIVAAHTT